jgi:hypothetical protein
MKTSITGTNSWIHHLHSFTPCKGTVVVGSGYGSWAEVLGSLDIEKAIFIEAESSKLERMKKIYPLLNEWHTVNQAVGSQEEEKEFYTLSNSSLSGFLPSEDLQHIWPNLVTLQSTKTVSKTLQTILQGTVDPSHYNWLIIECFGSLEILRGASSQLDDFEVVMVRIIEKDQVKVEAFLEKSGFSQMVSFEENNPQVNFIIYKRDINIKIYKQLKESEMKVKALTESKENLTVDIQNAKNDSAAFKTRSETLQKQLEESAQKTQTLISDKETLSNTLNTLQAEKSELTKNRDTLVKELENKNKELQKRLKREQQKIINIEKEKEYIITEITKLLDKEFVETKKLKKILTKECVFFNNFEQHNLGEYDADAFFLDWGYKPTPSSGALDKRLHIVEDPDNPKNKVLRVTCKKDEIGGRSASVFKYAIPQSSTKSLWFEYKVRFDDSFDWVLGGKLPGLAGYMNKKPTGCLESSELDGFSARFMWHQNGHFIQYMYSPTKKKFCGDDYITTNFFEPGKWYTISSYVQLNDIDENNGKVLAYLDGEKVLELSNLVLRTRSDVFINEMLFETFFGGGNLSWAPKKDEYIYFDDISITNKTPDFIKTTK